MKVVHLISVQLMAWFGSSIDYLGMPNNDPIHPSNVGEKLGFYFTDSEYLTLYLGILLILFAFYLFAYRLGRTKPLPDYKEVRTPPFDLSPAAIRFVEGMGYDTKCLIVAVLNAAVKGCYRIRWGKKGFLALQSEEPDFSLLSNDEKTALTFRKDSYWDKIYLAGSYSLKTRKMGFRMNKYLKKRYGKLYRSKTGWFIAGVVLSLALGLLLFGLPQGGRFLGGFCIYMFVLAAFVVTPLIFLRISVRDRYWYGVIMCVFFLLAGMVGLYVLEFKSIGPYMTPVVLPIVAINYFFYKKLPTYTRMGQVVMREIRGYRKYLKDRFVEHEVTQTMSAEEYLQDLPYAMAMDLDYSYTSYFKRILSITKYEPYQAFNYIYR